MKDKSVFGKVIALGVVLYLATLLIARSLIIPVMGDLFDGCSSENPFVETPIESFYADGLSFECTTTPFILIGLVGSILFLVGLSILGGAYSTKRKGKFAIVAGYILVTLLVGVFWRDVMILDETIEADLRDAEENGLEDVGLSSNLTWLGQPLNEELSDGYAYLYLWFQIMGGAAVGAIVYAFNRNEEEVQPVKAKAKTKAKTKTKAKAKKSSKKK